MYTEIKRKFLKNIKFQKNILSGEICIEFVVMYLPLYLSSDCYIYCQELIIFYLILRR